jgi:hypothetical protein
MADTRSGEEAALDVLQPPTQDVRLGGDRIVTVRPVNVGNLPKFLRAVRPIIAGLAESASASSPTGGQVGGDPQEVDLLGLYCDHGEALAVAVSLATGLPQAEVEAMDLDVFLTLARAVWEVNQDFFVRKVMPMLSETLRAAASLASPGNGPTP